MSKSTPPKKEVMSLRIEPRLKYLIDLAARIQRRNLTNYVEWALEESLKEVFMDAEKSITLADISTIDDLVWSTDESVRFLFLALNLKDLMTYEEQKIWELILSFPYLFLKNPDLEINNENIDDSEVKNYWSQIKQASSGDQEALTTLAEQNTLKIKENQIKTDGAVEDLINALALTKAKIGSSLTKEQREEVKRIIQEIWTKADQNK